ncbi:MAG TPA: family 1 glycosylhydrolase [Anaerolineales bacterium]|nr:family 1 glycosylhydrolase [Anaerolineales bacterium]
MPNATYTFPHNFLWGTATASHQVEGNNLYSDWWHWEQQPGKIKEGHTSGLACDWWGGRYLEDFDRMVAGSQNAHRLSVEWARIEPTPAFWDEDALDQYRQMLLALKARNIQPMVTLCHYCHPQWFLEMGGWQNPQSVAQFERYARKVVNTLGDLCDCWLTLNEPNAYVFQAYMDGNFPPGKKDMNAAFEVGTNLFRAHVSAYHAIHNLQPGAQVGWALYVLLLDPANPASWFDQQVTDQQHRLFNDAWPSGYVTGEYQTLLKAIPVPQAKGALDWVGLNYYQRQLVRFNPLQPTHLFGERFSHPQDEKSETNFISIHPQGLLRVIKWGAQLGLPMYITENGVEDSTDRIRPRFLAQHLRALWLACMQNYDVRGYFHWTLVDNFEWERGWTQRFGLYALDTATQTRTARPSAHMYAKICRENALSSAVVAEYAPEVLAQLFP